MDFECFQKIQEMRKNRLNNMFFHLKTMPLEEFKKTPELIEEYEAWKDRCEDFYAVNFKPEFPFGYPKNPDSLSSFLNERDMVDDILNNSYEEALKEKELKDVE